MLIRLSEHLKTVKALETPHQGTVVDNEDPKKLGRVKCTIPGIMVADKANLPWVISEADPSRFDVPELGAVLKVEFPYNDVYNPVFTGYWHSELNHNTDFDTDYPNTFGFVKQGFKFLYNKTSQLLDIIHPSGTTFQLDKDGNFISNIAKDITLAVAGKLGLTIDGDAKITATGAVEMVGDGAGKFVGKGGTEVGDASSSTMVNGSSVLLAGGGPAVALLGSQTIGAGNHGAPVTSIIVDGSSKVLAAK